LLAWPSNHVNYFSCCGVGGVVDGCCVGCWRKEVCRDYCVRKKGGSSQWLPLLPARKCSKGTGPPTITLLVRWWWLKKAIESEKEKRELLARKGKIGGG
jgi:hypothetical protein